MTSKIIKNEQWTVRDLNIKIKNGKIVKPKCQRKKKWDILPKKNNTPNEKNYILFLFQTKNSVHAITFGEVNVKENDKFFVKKQNIDGNNRINALLHFMNSPFEIFGCYLINLNKFIDSLNNLDSDENMKLKNIFKNMSYKDIIKFKYNKYFIENNEEEFYNNKLKIHRDEFESEIESIQNKLKIDDGEFDNEIKINVNIFYGYGDDDLCETFIDINKYDNKLTETELLAARLNNIKNFNIHDSAIKAQIDDCVKQYYKAKSEGELLKCYQYDNENDKLNAHDFIVGFQNLCSDKYNFIDITDTNGLSLFYKLYKSLYKSLENTFTTENVNEFINKVNDSLEIIQTVICNIFTSKINEKLFNNSCQKKLETLKKNNLYLLISCIIGFKNKGIRNENIECEIERALLYHFATSDIKNKDKREDLKNYDFLTYRAGGGFIDNCSKKGLSNPNIISEKLTKEKFSELFKHLCYESNIPYKRKLENGNDRNNKRRPLKFFAKTLMFYYYKEKIPTNILNNKFSIEHIAPNSSNWDNEIDKDRVGNLTPIIANMNCSRGYKHIKQYKNTKQGREFCDYMKEIIPSDNEYDSIIIQNTGRPFIINNKKYNDLCEKNETLYIDNLIKCLNYT